MSHPGYTFFEFSSVRPSPVFFFRVLKEVCTPTVTVLVRKSSVMTRLDANWYVMDACRQPHGQIFSFYLGARKQIRMLQWARHTKTLSKVLHTGKT